jgi:hypothetical protein
LPCDFATLPERIESFAAVRSSSPVDAAAISTPGPSASKADGALYRVGKMGTR